jgi:hypothetical protein
MKRAARIEVFAERGAYTKRIYRWNFIGANGRKVCTSGEAFHSHSNAVRAAKRFRELLFSETVEFKERLP